MKKNYFSGKTGGSFKSGKALLALGLTFLSGFSISQTTYTFTNAGATGRLGPTQGQINAAYLATNLNGSVTSVSGIQQFTIPVSSPYRIEAWGAEGGTNIGQLAGKGAYIKGEFTFAAGTVLNIVVGQAGGTGNGSGGTGGGGSFAYAGAIGGASLYVAAGGGGGTGHDIGFGGNGSANTTPVNGGGIGNGGFQGIGLGGNGGTNGGGYPGTWNSAASGGAGWGSAGLQGYFAGDVNYASSPGTQWVGGYQGTSTVTGQGGFGGGGGCGGNGVSGGGGGGYTGGGGGMNWPGTGNPGHGGGQGGGSFNAGINQVNTAGIQSSHGKIIITQLCSPGTTPTNTTPVNNQTLCANNTTTLSVIGTGTVNWYASPGSTVVLGTGSVFVTPTLSAGSYTYYAAATNTCAEGSRVPITVTVNPNPTITVNSGSICSGNSFTMVPSGANTYTFQGGNAVVTPTSNATYTVVGTSTAGCTSQSFATCNVTVNPTPSLSVSGSTLICGTGTNVFTASGADTYSWSTGAITSSISVSPSVTTVYTVVGTNTLGSCNASQTTTLTVSTNPTVSVTGSIVICSGQTTNLSASGANTYSWSNGAATATVALSPTATSVYTVIGTNTAGCMGANIQTVTVNAVPSVSVAGNNTICIGESATLTASGANTYSWNTGASTSSIIVSPTTTISYTATGTSSVTGCAGITVVTMVVNPCTGVANNSAALSGLSVYPNPSNGDFTIELKNGLSKNITIIDYTGKVVLNTTTAKDVINVSLASFANGIYNVKIQSNNTTQVIKVVKQ